MAKKPTKFGGKKRYATGGSTDRTQARYDRKVADIESDLEKALRAARGDTRRVNVARAKYEQRMADARDDLAGWRGQDRTNTRAEERTAERNLSTTRRTGVRTATAPERITSADIGAGRPAPTPISVADITPNAPNLRGSANRDAMRFGDAFRAAREAGEGTFTWQGRRYTTEVASPAARSTARPAAGSNRLAAGSNRPAAGSNRPAAGSNRPTARQAARQQLENAQARASRRNQTNRELNEFQVRGGPRANPNRPDQMRRTDFTPEEMLSPEQRAGVYRGMFQRQDGRASFSNAKGGKVKKMAKGGSIDGIAKRGKTRAKRKK